MTIQAMTKKECSIALGHRPRSLVNHIHHIRPKEYGGINRAENTVVLCPNHHYNTHEYLDALLAWDTHHAGQPFPAGIRRAYSKAERAIAEEGFKRIKEDTHRDPKWQGKGKQEAPSGVTTSAEVSEADGSHGQRWVEGEAHPEEGLTRG